MVGVPLPQTSDLGTYQLHFLWHLVMITGDLFKLVHLRTYLPLKLEARTVSKRVVHVLLECFLLIDL